MGIDLTPRCVKCGALIDLGSMKALPEGKGFVCTNCHVRGSGIGDVKPKLREPLPAHVQEDTKPVEDFFSAKDYVCDDCEYEFKKSAEFKVKLCPFCGKSNVHQKIDRPAEAFLADDDE